VLILQNVDGETIFECAIILIIILIDATSIHILSTATIKEYSCEICGSEQGIDTGADQI
jgi:hypothetical protein